MMWVSSELLFKQLVNAWMDGCKRAYDGYEETREEFESKQDELYVEAVEYGLDVLQTELALVELGPRVAGEGK